MIKCSKCGRPHKRLLIVTNKAGEKVCVSCVYASATRTPEPPAFGRYTFKWTQDPETGTWIGASGV